MDRRLRPTLAVAVAVAGLAALSDEAPVRVLFPANERILESGKFDVVCRALDGVAADDVVLEVDGEPHAWKPYAMRVLSVPLDLTPGSHGIKVGETKLCVFVGAEDADGAPDWPVYRSHRGKDGLKDCAECHKTEEQEGITHLGAPEEPTACLKCHPPEDFEAIHFHPLHPIASCHLCHALHGSTEEALLKGPVKELCADCHD